MFSKARINPSKKFGRRTELEFSQLERELVRVTGISGLSTDILKDTGAVSDKAGFNNAAALLADENTFMGIDMIRFGAGYR